MTFNLLKWLSGRHWAWRALRERWIAEHPTCAACGGTRNLVAHHIIPVSVDPTLELSWDNLLTLCENPRWNCHLIVGHGGNWSHYRPEAAADADVLLRRLTESPIVIPIDKAR